ncbi:MAG: 2,3-bisphosphoglycerate-independent phosphoglycerate mutase [Candidatus Micrarchaeia archaeon]
MAEKAILLIMDGLGDLPAPVKTPLEAAKKPNMDALAKKGMQGMMSTLGRGVVPGSDTAHLQILGYALDRYYCGRGPLEALGAGMQLREGDVAFRANFATIEGNMITDRRAGRLDNASAKLLEKDANARIQDVEVIFRASTEHRGALVLRGPGLSPQVSPTDSHREGAFTPAKPLDASDGARKTAEIVNEFTRMVHARLEGSDVNKRRMRDGKKPANIILLRGAGIMGKAPKFSEMHGIRGACVAGGALYKGVARYAGMDVPDVKGATGDAGTDLKAKGLAALEALQKNDFVFVHVKATDSFSHDGNAKGKTQFIEKVDKELIPALAGNGAALFITGDHSTACVRKAHTGCEVPVLAYYAGGRKDGLKKFGESSAMHGGLGHIEGKDVMLIILNMIGKGKMCGS